MKKKLFKVPLLLVNGDDEYHVGKFLGTGAYADCYEVLHNDGAYAAKIIPVNNITNKTKSYIEREINIHKTLKHDNIISLFDVFDHQDNLVLVMELGPCKTLDSIIKEEHILSEKIIKVYLMEILKPLLYLHRKGIIHRDIKPANLLVDVRRPTIKLCDFGMAIYTDDPSKNICGTPNYIAPEVLNKINQTCAVDMWSVGCTVFLMAFGFAPFETDTIKKTYKKIQGGEYHFPRHIIVSSSIKDFIEGLLMVDAYDRFTCEEAMNHSFLR